MTGEEAFVFLRQVFRRADCEHSYASVYQVEMFYRGFVEIKCFMKSSSISPAKAQVKIMYLNLNSEYNVNQEVSLVILMP